MKSEKFKLWMSFKVEDHYDLRKHLHVDHNMIFDEERKSSCDECHSELKTTTTWENTCTLTITWFFYEEQISSCVECHSEFFVLAEMSFTVEDHYDFRKHINIYHNMIFYEERKTSCDECHSELKTTTTWENTCTLTIT